MSRSGRAVELLNAWREHPKGCTAEHSGWGDGYDGPCTDDPWDIVQALELIDPMFHQDEIQKLRGDLAAAEERGAAKEQERAAKRSARPPVYERPDQVPPQGAL